MATLAFIADSHLGYRHRFKSQRLKDLKDAFEDAVEKALSKDPDVVVFLGDLVHHARPDPVSIRVIINKLMKVAEKAHVVVAIGNHEIEGHLGTTYSPIYGDIHRNIHVLSSAQNKVELTINGKRYGFYGFEYIRNPKLASDALKNIKPDSDVNILCLHQAIERYLSPAELSIADLRQAADGYDLMVFGHVHKHQKIKELTDIVPAYYCGSTERTSFNEAGNQTGFLTFTDDDFQHPQFNLTDSAKMTRIKRDFSGSPDELNQMVSDILKDERSALVRVDIAANIVGDMTKVRRDWHLTQTDRTICEINIIQIQKDANLSFEPATLDEQTLRQYFKKIENKDEQLESTCIELFRKYGGSGGN